MEARAKEAGIRADTAGRPDMDQRFAGFPPRQIPWKRTAAVEEETPVGSVGFDIGCVEVAARNRFQVLEEPLEVNIGGLESR